jgi:hypothetical protein
MDARCDQARFETSAPTLARPRAVTDPEPEPVMPAAVRRDKCEVCGNEYDKSFQVIVDGTTHTFDSFECAVHRLAPTCSHCGCRILGHGIEAAQAFFCCSSCARQSGVHGTQDRARS